MKVFNHKTSYHGGDLLWQNRLPEYPCVYHHIIKIISLNNNRAGGIFRFQRCRDKIGTNWGPNEILLSWTEGHTDKVLENSICIIIKASIIKVPILILLLAVVIAEHHRTLRTSSVGSIFNYHDCDQEAMANRFF